MIPFRRIDRGAAMPEPRVGLRRASAYLGFGTNQSGTPDFKTTYARRQG